MGTPGKSVTLVTTVSFLWWLGSQTHSRAGRDRRLCRIRHFHAHPALCLLPSLPDSKLEHLPPSAQGQTSRLTSCFYNVTIGEKRGGFAELAGVLPALGDVPSGSWLWLVRGHAAVAPRSFGVDTQCHPDPRTSGRRAGGTGRRADGPEHRQCLGAFLQPRRSISARNLPEPRGDRE